MSTRVSRRRAQADFSAEIQAHLDLEAERLAADGLDPETARHQARRTFGNVVAAQERYYEAHRWAWLEQILQDLRYGVRSLRQHAAYTATIVCTLAVGLGPLTALFTVLDVYVLRPLAIHDPARVYHVRWRLPGSGGFAFGTREFDELRARHDLFVDAVAQRHHILTSNDRGLHAAFVSGNYFDVLQPRVRLGRAIAPFDARTPGGAPVAVLSDQAWARLFDRDPQVLGRRLDLNGHAFEIVGVMQPEFVGMDDQPRDAWLPLTTYPTLSGENIYDAAQPNRLTVFARLRHDVSPAQAAQALAPFMAGVEARARPDHAVDAEKVRADLEVRSSLNPPSLEIVAMLAPVLVAFGLVLAAACANVSNVLLARAIARHREIGIRLALGASRGRIVRQLLTEALLVSTIAGVAGLALAAVALDGGRRLFFATLPASMVDLLTVQPLALNYRVFLFAFAAATATTLCFALLPALQATRLTLTGALRGLPAPGVRSGWLRDCLVAGQVTVSLVLLVADATFARNGAVVASTDLGLDMRGVFSVNQRSDGSALIRPAAEALATDPRVSLVAVTSRNPLFGRFPGTTVKPDAAKETMRTSYVFVSPEYFPLLRIPIVRGRAFQTNEALAEARVGIVSERTAQAFWPGRDPVGQVVRLVSSPDRPDATLAGYSEITIVGVAKDVVSGMIYDGPDPSLLYLPTSPTGARAGALLVRGRDAGGLQRGGIGQVLERAHPDRQAFETLPLADMAAIMLYPLQAASWIGSLLGRASAWRRDSRPGCRRGAPRASIPPARCARTPEDA